MTRPPRIVRIDPSQIDFTHFEYSCVFWLGAGPMWTGRIRNDHGGKTGFLYRLTPTTYTALMRHHENAGDRRLKADPPPPREWFLEGFNKGMFVSMPVIPQASVYREHPYVDRKTRRRRAAAEPSVTATASPVMARLTA